MLTSNWGVLPFATQKCMKTVVACFKLHKCIKDRLPMPEVTLISSPRLGEEDINYLQANGAGGAQQIRERERVWFNAFKIISSIKLQVKRTRDLDIKVKK